MKRLLKEKLLCAVIALCFVPIGIVIHQKHHYNALSSYDIQNARRKLAELTLEERKNLKRFIQYECEWFQMPYSLIGTKPMCISDIRIRSKNCPIKKTSSIQSGWETWLKYQYIFSSQNTHFVSFTSEGFLIVLCINIRLCQSIIEKNLSDFHKILNRSLSTNEIIQILHEPENPLFHRIIDDDLLLGILLGYGRTNAFLVKQTGGENLQTFNSEEYWHKTWKLPYFVCDPSLEETKKLKKAYREDRKKIHWTYFGRDVLETTIGLLAK